eukprot:g5517.t1
MPLFPAAQGVISRITHISPTFHHSFSIRTTAKFYFQSAGLNMLGDKRPSGPARRILLSYCMSSEVLTRPHVPPQRTRGSPATVGGASRTSSEISASAASNKENVNTLGGIHILVNEETSSTSSETLASLASNKENTKKRQRALQRTQRRYMGTEQAKMRDKQALEDLNAEWDKERKMRLDLERMRDRLRAELSEAQERLKTCEREILEGKLRSDKIIIELEEQLQRELKKREETSRQNQDQDMDEMHKASEKLEKKMQEMREIGKLLMTAVEKSDKRCFDENEWGGLKVTHDQKEGVPNLNHSHVTEDSERNQEEADSPSAVETICDGAAPDCLESWIDVSTDVVSDSD